MANPLVATEQRPEVPTGTRIGLLVGGIPIIATLLRVFGVFDLNAEQIRALDDVAQWGALLGGATILGDTALRFGRNVADAKVNAAAVAPAVAVPVAVAPAPVAASDDDPDEIPDDELPPDEEEFGEGTGPDDPEQP